MAQRHQFTSVLDYRPQFENIIDALIPDIEFSYSAIMNNTTVETYFNMISMELYGYEYFQILRLNNLQFKLDEKTLSLTILEMLYNIVTEIVARKWRYSEYIAYDMYILPLRIKKYINAVNYKFIKVENAHKKALWKLISAKTRVITEELIDSYHDDRINNIIIRFRGSSSTELETKVSLIKNLSVFLNNAKDIAYNKFGKEFSDEYYKNIDIIEDMKSDDLTDKQKKWVTKNVNDVFDIGVVIILYMSDAIKAGVWTDVKAQERRKLELNIAKQQIEDANEKLKQISIEEEKAEKTLLLS